MEEQILEALKRYFGHDSFRNAQEEVVRRLLSGEELCVVMPTGAGKSVCYQLPIMMRPGYGLVVSPLISLMKDQVDQLNGKGLPAACINSSLSLGEQQRVMDDVRAGRVKFLYVAPERFRSPSFRALLQSQAPNLVVIDEAHCVSQWGHDFRPDYQRIWQTTPELAHVQIAAFTATATPPVREDIKKQILRPEMSDVVSGFKRPNLSFEVVTCKGRREKIESLRKLLQVRMPTIIYAATRKEVELVSDAFQCRRYHAGMSDSERTKAQEYFMQDECPLLAATNAFGMGIDRPDIRRVIHFSIPKSLEAYYQEAGRAGRDGAPAECILFFSYQDIRIQEYLLEINNPGLQELVKMHQLLLRLDQQSHGQPVFSGELGAGEGKDGQIAQTSLNLLARYGIVERVYATRSLGGTLSFLYPLEARELHPEGPLTQRSLFLQKLVGYFKEMKVQALSCTVEIMSQITGLRPDQVERVLAALSGQLLYWEPVQLGGDAFQLTEHGRHPDLQMDFGDLKAHTQIEYGRLDSVKKYAKSFQCRQAFLISYFGEKIGTWKCGKCDTCTVRATMETWTAKPAPRPAVSHPSAPLTSVPAPKTDDEQETILNAVEDLNGRFGAVRIAKMLHGEQDESNHALNDSGYFGALQGTSYKHILAVIYTMVREGSLHFADHNGYSCLEV